MTDAGRRWRLDVRSRAQRQLSCLPEKVATAVAEFIIGPLVDNPYRVGHPLHDEYAGQYSARRGREWRIRYRPSRRERIFVCRLWLGKRIRWPTDRVVLGEAGSTALAESAGARLEGRMDTSAGPARNQARPSRHLPLS